MFTKQYVFSILCLLISFFSNSQEVTNNWVAGKWNIEEVIVPDQKFNDKKERIFIAELGKTVLHFKGDGHFSFIYSGDDKELIRNIKELENVRWNAIEGENAILLEKETPLVVLPVEIGENIIIGFFQPIKFRVSKIKDELVNFLPKPAIERENVEVERNVDSVFKFVEVDKKGLKDSVISEYPVLEGCEKKKGVSCFNKVIRNRIARELNLKKYKSVQDSKRMRLSVSFVIDIDKGIKNIETTSEDEALSYDLKLIMNNLGVIEQAKDDRGKPMISSYIIPLTLLIR
ncbi:hypothetical protein [Aquimarina sp. Aq107]|uniref:hypothetical protein n=1 Tax=Aquimarina sp. Aq107 TaxID=1191912 RepID=UPI000D55849F|nr:hypothetical protein [Aquimarina sp. Aq107]